MKVKYVLLRGKVSTKVSINDKMYFFFLPIVKLLRGEEGYVKEKKLNYL